MGSRLGGFAGGRTHGYGTNHCCATESIFTPDCATKKTETSSIGPAKIVCIRCGEKLSEANATSLPFLCNRCRGSWKTRSLEISLAFAWNKQKIQEIFFLVALNPNDIAGIYDPGYNRNPVYLGFLAGFHKATGGIRFLDPKLVLNTLKLF